MKTFRNAAGIASALLLAAGLAGCSEDGKLEQLGEKMDEKVEQARDQVEDATGSQGPLERAGENLDDAVRQAGEQASDALERASDEVDRATSG